MASHRLLTPSPPHPPLPPLSRTPLPPPALSHNVHVVGIYVRIFSPPGRHTVGDLAVTAEDVSPDTIYSDQRSFSGRL